jgi:1-deoxy-D-xylulose-5-phosphate synthase
MALNGYPVVMLVKGGHITENSNTHQGIFDIGMISSIPNLEYLAPTNAEELISMLRWALTQTDKPVVIREPITEVRHGEADDDYTEINYRIANQGEKVAILGLGAFYKLGEDVQRKLKEVLNINATLINPISATTLDVETLNNLKKDHELVVTLEDASMVGGFGEKVDHFYADSEMKVLNFGAQKELTDMVPVEELYDRYHLNPEQIVDDIKRVID